MAFIREYKRNGRIYRAKVKNTRRDGKVIQEVIEYLGPKPRDKSNLYRCNIQTTDVGNIQHYGSVLVMHEIAKAIGITDGLGQDAAAILPLVFSHLHDHSSVYKLSEWFKETSIQDITGFEIPTEKQVYNSLSSLNTDRIFEIEKSTYENMTRYCDEKSTSVIYDVTNTYFTGNRCSIGRKGRDKQGRTKNPLIQVGIVVTKGNRLPLFHQVHPGNSSEHHLFTEAIFRLNRFDIKRGIICYDRGLNSKNAILNLVSDKWRIVGGVPKHNGVKKKLSEVDLNRFQNYGNLVRRGRNNFYVKFIPFNVGNITGKLAIVLDPLKKQDQMDKRIGTLRKFMDSNEVDIPPHLDPFFNKNGRINHHALRRVERYDGINTIFTTGRFSRQDVIDIYFDKDAVEKVFQDFKGVLCLRPIRCWLEKNVRSHIFICYLSYCILATFRCKLYKYRMKIDKPEISYLEALEELKRLRRVTIFPDGRNSRRNPINKVVFESDLQKQILKIFVNEF